MKYLSKFLAVALTLLALSACHPEEKALNEYRSLAEEVEQDGAEFSEKDWEIFFGEVENAEKKLQEYEYSAEQRREIRQLRKRLYKSIGTNSVNLFKDAMKDAADMIEGLSSGFMEGLDDLGKETGKEE